MMAEAPLSGERRHCGRGVFNMVAVGDGLQAMGGALLPLGHEPEDDGPFSMVALVLPDETSHYGSLYGGHALKWMAKAAFVVATRRCRKAVVMASSQRVDFISQIRSGEIAEITARVSATGRSSMTVEVELWAEAPHRSERRRCGAGGFIMVAVDEHHRPTAIANT
jgi:acyl-CoA hydrolase